MEVPQSGHRTLPAWKTRVQGGGRERRWVRAWAGGQREEPKELDMALAGNLGPSGGTSSGRALGRIGTGAWSPARHACHACHAWERSSVHELMDCSCACRATAVLFHTEPGRGLQSDAGIPEDEYAAHGEMSSTSGVLDLGAPENPQPGLHPLVGSTLPSSMAREMQGCRGRLDRTAIRSAVHPPLSRHYVPIRPWRAPPPSRRCCGPVSQSHPTNWIGHLGSPPTTSA